MQKRSPDVLDFLDTISFPRAMDDYDSKVPRLCTSYNRLRNTGWNELCLVQKMNPVLLGVGSVATKVLLLHLVHSLNILCIHHIGITV